MTSSQISKRPKLGDVFVGDLRLYRDERECKGLYVVTGMAKRDHLMAVYLQPIESQEVNESKRYTKRGWFKTSVDKKAVTPIVYAKTESVRNYFYLQDYKDGKAFQRGFGYIMFTLVKPDQNGDYLFVSEIIGEVKNQNNYPYQYAPVFRQDDKEEKKKDCNSSSTFCNSLKNFIKKWISL